MLGRQRSNRSLSPALIVGKNIRSRMEAKELTINQLAVRTNIPTGTLRQYLKGNHFPVNGKLGALAKALGVNQGQLTRSIDQ